MMNSTRHSYRNSSMDRKGWEKRLPLATKCLFTVGMALIWASGTAGFTTHVESCSNSRIKTILDHSNDKLTQAHLTLKNAENGGGNDMSEPEVFRTFELMAAAHALSYHDLEKAKEMFEIILDHQTDSGMIPHLWYSTEPSEPDRSLWGFGRSNGNKFSSNLPTQPFLALSIMHWFDESIDQAGGVDGPENDEERSIGETAIDFLETNFDKVHSFYEWWFHNRAVEIESGKGELLVNHHPWETLLPATITWDHLYEETNLTVFCSTGNDFPLFAKQYPVEFANVSRMALDQCLAQCYSINRELTSSNARASNCSVSLATVTTNAEAYLSLQQLERMGSIAGASSSKLNQVKKWKDAVLDGSLHYLLSSTKNFGFDAEIRYGEKDVAVSSRQEYLSTNAAILSLGELNTTDSRFQSGVQKWKSDVLSTLLAERFLPGPSFCSLDRLSPAFNTSSGMNGPVWLRSNALLLYSLEQLGAAGLVSALRSHSQKLLCQESQSIPEDAFSVWEAYDSATGKALEGSESNLANANAIFVLHRIPKMAVPDNRSVNLVGIGVAVAINVLVVLGMASGCVVIGLKVLRNMSQMAARQGGRDRGLGFAVPTLHEYDDQAGADSEPVEKAYGIDGPLPAEEHKAAYTVQPTIDTQNVESETQAGNQRRQSWIPVTWFPWGRGGNNDAS
eukprot:gb/GECG01010112.1/.p1 GENE.gb/GECG01010112.1/~~gb/GECG01010112.1/.p1  ORF type:complete len:677 (+),score=72.40 gb/GECG01010112.1/:1-2031(+)